MARSKVEVDSGSEAIAGAKVRPMSEAGGGFQVELKGLVLLPTRIPH